LNAAEAGMNQIAKWSDKWNGLIVLGQSSFLRKDFYLPANVNAALADINKC
jgi:hypothetical protein